MVVVSLRAEGAAISVEGIALALARLAMTRQNPQQHL